LEISSNCDKSQLKREETTKCVFYLVIVSSQIFLKVIKMKSILFISALSLFLFSCDSILDSGNSQISIGKVHKLEMSSWMYGTHSLDDSNGKLLYALTSSTIDLNNYENKEVRITGSLIKGYPVDGVPKYLNVTSISVLR